MYLTVAAAAGDGFFGASGICVVSEDAFNVGVTAVPKPLDDDDSDLWLWHNFFDIAALSVTLTDGVNAMGANLRLEIDSKAMRKGFDSKSVIVGVTQVVERGTATVEHHARTRILFKGS